MVWFDRPTLGIPIVSFNRNVNSAQDEQLTYQRTRELLRTLLPVKTVIRPSSIAKRNQFLRLA